MNRFMKIKLETSGCIFVSIFLKFPSVHYLKIMGLTKFILPWGYVSGKCGAMKKMGYENDKWSTRLLKSRF